MADIMDEGLQQVKLLKEVDKLLFSTTAAVDLFTITRWKIHFLLSIKTFRKVLRNNKLSVAQKQSILCTLAKVECMKARLEVMAIRKSGAGVQEQEMNTSITALLVKRSTGQLLAYSIQAELTAILC
ncbi:hypothetical protein TSAR_015417 [Trichomalopsis sarcophagae]|uniref:Uncharacterized protein n=1 Tax=Trichomalopsis sarcophagae TaxID=543379 RepID=A0A232EIZ8_9HYME|nr:hypothetical protein TSAR_015417 [Trichomalopsis sarcophagae]